MRKLVLPVIFFCCIATFYSFTGGGRMITANSDKIVADTIHYPEEKHFSNVQQLTFGGDNAEAYFSYDSKWVVFQRTNPKEGIPCDRIFIGKLPEKPGD